MSHSPRFKDLLLQLLEAEPSDRARMLDTLEPDDRSLRPELERMLALAETGPLREQAAAARDFPTTIGPYRIERLIGRGGMGDVFYAREPQPLERPVALKLIRSGRVNENTLRRFELERRTLTELDHPSVARVLDAGVTEELSPYVVMEYIHGPPITEYCSAEALDLRQRVGLMMQVVAAVTHAHLAGFVHRDIKPANILVTRIDGEPVSKLIDFGIAKVIDADAEEAGTTSPGLPIGTVEYMSPEQSAGLHGRVDQRSDIYSLGIVMHEVFTGRIPFSSDDLLEMRGAGMLERLETRHRQVFASTLHSDSASSGVPVRELGWIVAKACAPAPESRYQSAHALHDDLERVLSNRAVSAGPQSVWYRAKKAVQRRPVASGAVAAAVLGITTAAAIVVQSRAELADALAETEVAYGDAAESADFLLTTLQDAAYGHSPGSQTVGDFLDRAVESLDEAPDRLGTSRWRVRSMLSLTDMMRGDPQRAVRQADEALRLATDLFGASSFEVGVVQARRARVLREAGESELASAAAVEAERTLRDHRDRDPVPWLTSVSWLADLDLRSGDFASAEQRIVETIAIWESFDEPSNGLLNARLVLASALSAQRRHDDAIRQLDLALAEASGVNNLEPAFERELAWARISTLERMGDFESAVEEMDDYISAIEAWYGGEHVAVMQAHMIRAEMLIGAGADQQDVLSALEHPLSIARSTLEPGSEIRMYAEYVYAKTLYEFGRMAEAVPLLAASWESHAGALGEAHPNTISIRLRHINGLIELSEVSLAAELLEACEEVIQASSQDPRHATRASDLRAKIDAIIAESD